MIYFKLVNLASYLPYDVLARMGRIFDTDPLGGPPGSFWFEAHYARYCRRDTNG